MTILVCLLILIEIILCVLFAKFAQIASKKLNQLSEKVKNSTPKIIGTMQLMQQDFDAIKIIILDKFETKPFGDDELVSLIQAIFKLYIKYSFLGFKFVTRPILFATVFTKLYRNRERLGLTLKKYLHN